MKRLDRENVEDMDMEEMTQEEQNEVLRGEAEDILEGILAAADNVATKTREIVIRRNGKKYFRIVIRPVPESKAKEIKRKCTEFKKNKAYGITVPGETDAAKYRSMLIHEATVNKEETWDNKALWKALESRFPVVTGWQTIDQVLLAGEKERVVDEIDTISGYAQEEEEELEETVKN